MYVIRAIFDEEDEGSRYYLTSHYKNDNDIVQLWSPDFKGRQFFPNKLIARLVKKNIKNYYQKEDNWLRSQFIIDIVKV